MSFRVAHFLTEISYMFTYYNTYILQVYHSELLVTSSSLPSSLSSGCADCSGVHSLDDHDYCDDHDKGHDYCDDHDKGLFMNDVIT